MPRMPGCEDDEPPSADREPKTAPAEKFCKGEVLTHEETEAAIDALTAPGTLPSYVTLGDIRKARKAGRRLYRQDLSIAVRGELSRKAINIDDIVKTVMDDTVSTVKRRVMEELAKADVSGALIRTEIEKLVRGEFGRNGLPSIKAFLEAEAQAYAKDMINQNVVIKVQEGKW